MGVRVGLLGLPRRITPGSGLSGVRARAQFSQEMGLLEALPKAPWGLYTPRQAWPVQCFCAFRFSWGEGRKAGGGQILAEVRGTAGLVPMGEQ